MAVAALLAGAAERDVLQHRDIVLDHRGLADHEAGGMVEEDALADAGGRVDVGLEDFGGTALQIEREIAPALVPEPMRQAVGLQGMEALEIEHRLDQPVAGRVTIEHGGDVGAKALGDLAVIRDRLVESLGDQLGRQRRMAEARGDAMGDRRLEARLVHHRREDEAGQRRLGRDRLFGFAAQARPDRVDPVEPGDRIACLEARTTGWHEHSPLGFRGRRSFYDGAAVEIRWPLS